MEGFVPIDGLYSYSGSTLRIGVSGAMAIFLTIGSLVGPLWKSLGDRPLPIACASAASFLGTAMLYVATLVADSDALIGVGLLLSNAGNAALMLIWGEYFTRVRSNEMALNVAAAFCFAFVVIAIVLGIGSLPIAVASALLLPLLSGAIRIYVSLNASKAVALRQEVVGSFFWKMAAALFFIGLAYGFVRALAPWSAAIQAHKVEVNVLGLVIFGFMICSSFLLKKDFHTVRFYRLAVFLAVGGCVCAPLLDAESEWIALSAIVVGQILFQMLVWLVNPEVVIRLKSGRIVGIFGWTMAVLYGGMFIGAVSATFLPARFGADAYAWTIAIFAVGMLGFFLYVFRERDLIEAVSSHDGGIEAVTVGVSSEAIDLVSRQCGLTSREREVATLLAQGRTIPYIAETLCIAQSTVKTHVRHIYEKMGVKDRQDLIDSLQRLGR